MKFTQNVKVQKRSTDGTVTMTIPKKFAEAIGLENGTLIQVVLDSDKPNQITLVKE